jgi:hypothetical protein
MFEDSALRRHVEREAGPSAEMTFDEVDDVVDGLASLEPINHHNTAVLARRHPGATLLGAADLRSTAMDSNTFTLFLATVATATSALVAIVGGLLVARVVAIASERNGLHLRIEELSSGLGKALTEHDKFDASLRRALGTQDRQRNIHGLTELSPVVRENDQVVRRLEDRKWQAALRVESLTHQRDLLDAALARVAHPTGIVTGVWVLSGFAFAGAVVPLALLLTVKPSRGVAITALLLFVGGLIALVCYILSQVRDLTAHPNQPVASSPQR